MTAHTHTHKARKHNMQIQKTTWQTHVNTHTHTHTHKFGVSLNLEERVDDTHTQIVKRSVGCTSKGTERLRRRVRMTKDQETLFAFSFVLHCDD